MTSIPKTASVALALALALILAATLLLSVGILSARGDASQDAQTAAARNATHYLSRTAFDNDAGQGVVESLSRINGNAVPIPIDLLISLHGLQPNVAYRVVGSKRACSQRHRPVDEVFGIDLPATAGTDRFFKQNIDGSGSPKHIKSARIFDNGVRVGCKATKLYTLARYP